MSAQLSRAYRSEDLPRVVALLEERLNAALHWNMSVSDVRRVLPRRDTATERYGRVWENSSGRLVGFGLVWVPWDTAYVLVHPEHDPGRVADPTLSGEVLRWAEGCAAEIAGERGKAMTLRTRARDSDERLRTLLERHGFREEEAHSLTYRRALGETIPEPVLPSGFTVRHVRGEQEVDAYAALHREAFGTPHMTAEGRLALMRGPGYVPELDLVAVAPDGTLAAFVLGEILREESRAAGKVVGSTDPLGTRPAYRRLGLARALLLEAFRRLRSHGAETTRVSTGSWNVPTRFLVESVGYQLDYRTLAYAKTIDRGDAEGAAGAASFAQEIERLT